MLNSSSQQILLEQLSYAKKCGKSKRFKAESEDVLDLEELTASQRQADVKTNTLRNKGTIVEICAGQ